MDPHSFQLFCELWLHSKSPSFEYYDALPGVFFLMFWILKRWCWKLPKLICHTSIINLSRCVFECLIMKPKLPEQLHYPSNASQFRYAPPNLQQAQEKQVCHCCWCNAGRAGQISRWLADLFYRTPNLLLTARLPSFAFMFLLLLYNFTSFLLQRDSQQFILISLRNNMGIGA